MVRGGFMCSRNTLIFLNVLYFVVGVMLIVLAAYCRALTTLPVMGAIIACGVFLSVIAVVGVVGAVKHHQVSLFFYMLILFLIFLLQFSVACVCLSISKDQEKTFFQIGWELASNDLKMRTQKMFHCCGMDAQHQLINEKTVEFNHPECASLIDACTSNNTVAECCKEYKSNGMMKNITNTPMNTRETSTSITTTLSPTTPSISSCPAPDCWSLIQPKLHQTVRSVGIISLVFSFTELIGIWLTFRYRNQKDPRANPSAFL